MAHRNGERVALGTLIGLFRTKGRKGSPIVRGYLHTNSIMVIRNAPLEALEARRALFLAFAAGTFVPIIFSVKEEPESPRAPGSHVFSLSLLLFFRMFFHVRIKLIRKS